jgi:hypothetical protein
MLEEMLNNTIKFDFSKEANVTAHANAFMTGFRMNSFTPNGTACV